MRAVALVYRPSTLTPGARVVAIWTSFTAWQRTWLIPSLFAVVVAIQAPGIWAACKTYTHSATGSSIGPEMRYLVCDTSAEKPAGMGTGDLAWATDTGKLYAWSGSAWAELGGGGADLSGEPFATSASTGALSAERVLTGGTNTTVDTGTPGQLRVNFSGSLAESSVTGLVSDLAGKVPTARSVATTAPLAGGGDLSGDRTLTVATFGSGASGVVPASGGGTINFLRADATWAAPAGGGGGGPTVARVTADVANNSATVWADVTGLTHAVSASTTYTYECRLTYITAATTTALHLSTNGPASPTSHRYAVVVGTTATAKHEASQTAYNTVTNPATGGGATGLTAVIAGTFENGANAGTLAIRFKSEIASSAVTVQRGSACRFY